MARVASRDSKRAPARDGRRLRAAWRRWETATEALDSAKEAEDFQAVGMRCRETLVALVKSLQKAVAVPAGDEAPKAADVKGWFKYIALHYAPGARNEHVRSYLRSTSAETWQVVNWLTHTANAGLHEAQLALDATSNLLSIASRIVMKSEAATPVSCPTCGSYRIAAIFDPDIPRDPPYLSLCQSCGLHDLEDDAGEAIDAGG